jgi:hypothetical protein
MNIPGKRLHRTLFGIEEVEDEVEQEQGRSAELIETRNERLLYRYTWYSLPGKLDRDYILEQLKVEFELRPFTIGKIINENIDKIMRMKKEWNLKKVMERYYWMKW